MLGVFFARLRLDRVLRRWWTLLDEGGTRRGNLVVFLGVPAVVGVIVVAADLRADGFDGYMATVAVVAGLLFNLVFQLSDWSQASSNRLEEHEAGRLLLDSAEVTLARRRLLLIQRAYADLCWAVVVAIGLLVVLAVLGTGSQQAGSLATAVVSVVAAHLILVLLSALSSAFTVTAADLDRHAR
ncbi:hypothetical protein [Aquipuribacter hungaricus]|uniref:ABC transporter permease n=1 Tax=Aquipuribacter hungaricus TaxID=545624 RepID=A0ABV7WJ76_9MICO